MERSGALRRGMAGVVRNGWVRPGLVRRGELWFEMIWGVCSRDR